jgi:pimeloyl-ACP methyl ester carboxylesterase
MVKTPVTDVIVLIPGITGSVLAKDGKDVWALSADAVGRGLRTIGRSLRDLELQGDDPDADDLGDGITAPRVQPDTHLIPGLWKIDGYGKLATTMVKDLDVERGVNLFELPYDWRRDNRVAARLLARRSHEWLSAWRDRSGNPDAKLILVGHSMGGLVARHFLELLDGWRDTRLLITFGTPYRGSLNALDFVANGMRKKLGPLTLLNLTALVRSFTSVYQLLPIYPCVEQEDGTLGRVTEVRDIPGLDTGRAAAALGFHDGIRQAVREHRESERYAAGGYQIKPLAGIFQPTSQSARPTGSGLRMLRTYRGTDQGGDGTVPSVSATPLELSNMDLEVYIRERHASLQNADFSLDQVLGIMRRQRIDQSQMYAPGTGISLDIDDVALAGEPIIVRAMPEQPFATLVSEVQDAGSGRHVTGTAMREDADGWHRAEFAALPEGTYRIRVRAADPSQAINPVTDVFVVVPEGTDIDG